MKFAMLFVMEPINKRKAMTFLFMTLVFIGYFQYQAKNQTANLDDAYYDVLRQSCGENTCCLSSVETMQSSKSAVFDEYCKGVKNQLRCAGSVAWCVR